jgi:N-terminal domain of anti-restriction factor ArdC
MSTDTHQISAASALTFKHFSVHNAVAAEAACSALECRAYTDIFTRRRWRAQGYRVRKGEQGTAITTWIVTPARDDGEGKLVRRPKRVFVFCRHQVEQLH